MNDLDKQRWPGKEEALDKIDFEVKPFMRIHWYYEDELNFYENEEYASEHPKKYPTYSGVVVPKYGVVNNGKNSILDIDRANVIIDQNPVVKEQTFYIYITLSQLLDMDDLVEIMNNRDLEYNEEA